MRIARIKPHHEATWHHCYSRAVGTCRDRPFDKADKAYFVRLMHRVSRLYCIRIAAYQIMDNHFHLLVKTPEQAPALAEVSHRYNQFFSDYPPTNPGSPTCLIWQERMGDISWFMRHLLQLYTMWYNRTRRVRRRGPLWAGRFKNTVLEDGEAVWQCYKYIEFNPIRAGKVRRTADYRFGSFGVWAHTGKHPFACDFAATLLPALRSRFGLDTESAVRCHLGRIFIKHEAIFPPKPPSRFELTVQDRVRYWTDGLIIGSLAYLKTIAGHIRESSFPERHIVPAEASLAGTTQSAMSHKAVYAYRKLRDIPA